MATETLILRPTGGDNIAQVTMYPANTPDEDVWKLVAEEVADDDATYYQASGIGTTNITFTIPDDYITRHPVSIKMYHRIRCEEECTINIYHSIISSDGDGISSTIYASYTVTATTYITYCSAVPFDNIDSFYTTLIDESFPKDSNGHTTVTCIKDNGKGASAYVTQIYLELTYASPDTIYLKEDGSWVENEVTAYQKVNGVWTLTDLSALTDGTQYVLVK